MSKFNKKAVEERVVNHMGSKSFSQSTEAELVFAVVTTFLEDTYYEGKNERTERIVALAKKCSPEFVSKLAVVARREFHMRSVSHLLAGELAKMHRGDSLVKDTIVAVAERPDDLTEIASYVGLPLPKQVKRGIRNAILKFNRYQLAKYKMEGKEFSLVDLFNLTHPKAEHANKEQKKAWKDLINGDLKSVDTWEAKNSTAESDEERTDNWEELIKTGNIGYMALLRNLNNLMKYGVSEKIIKLAAKRLADPDEVKKSKQFPFRFLSAYEAIGGTTSKKLKFEDEQDSVTILRTALGKALEASLDNLPELPGRTLILTDNSGSMRGDARGSAISAASNTKSSDIANLFAVMYWKKANSTIVGVFGDRLETPKLDREKDIFENFAIIDKVGSGIGGGTETGIFEMFEQLVDQKKMVDRIVIFSDCQVGTGCKWYDTSRTKGGADFNQLWKAYKKINPKVRVYSIDLRGYGNSMFQDDVFKLAGWSDKIFSLMDILEKGDGIVSYIEEYDIMNG